MLSMMMWSQYDIPAGLGVYSGVDTDSEDASRILLDEVKIAGCLDLQSLRYDCKDFRFVIYALSLIMEVDTFIMEVNPQVNRRQFETAEKWTSHLISLTQWGLINKLVQVVKSFTAPHISLC